MDSDVEVEDTEDVTAPGNAHPPRSAAPIKQHASTLEDDSSKEQGLGDDEWKDDDGEDAAEPRNAYVDFESEVSSQSVNLADKYIDTPSLVCHI